MKDLTPRQREILTLIERHIDETGYPPTRLDICRALGFKSPNAAEEHLRTLARKGVIEITAGASRGIRLLKEPSTPAVATAHVESNATKLINTLSQWLDLPLVGRVAAGSPILAEQHIEQRYQFDPSMFDQRPDYLLKVRGMSMRDAGILDGDLLAVRKLHQADAVRNGQIVVARIGDDVTVKRFRRQADKIELLPENPDYQPIVITKHEPNFALEGLGVGLIRNSRLL